MVAGGVDLTLLSEAEEFEYLEFERAQQNKEFGRDAMMLAAMCQDNRHGNDLIEQLRKIYFIGYEEHERSRMEKEVEELVKLTKKTFRLHAVGKSHKLEVT